MHKGIPAKRVSREILEKHTLVISTWCGWSRFRKWYRNTDRDERSAVSLFACKRVLIEVLLFAQDRVKMEHCAGRIFLVWYTSRVHIELSGKHFWSESDQLLERKRVNWEIVFLVEVIFCVLLHFNVCMCCIYNINVHLCFRNTQMCYWRMYGVSGAICCFPWKRDSPTVYSCTIKDVINWKEFVWKSYNIFLICCAFLNYKK